VGLPVRAGGGWRSLGGESSVGKQLTAVCVSLAIAGRQPAFNCELRTRSTLRLRRSLMPRGGDLAKISCCFCGGAVTAYLMQLM